MKKAITAIIAVVIIALMALGYADAAAHRAHSGGAETEVDPQEIIFEHLGDAYGWEVPFNHSQRIPLPVIVRAQDGSWHAFLSSRLADGAQYDGFQIAEGGDYNNKVVQILPDGSQYRPIDLSITKNVAGIFIAALLVLLMVFKVRNWYKKNGLKAPRRFTAALELVVDFVYTDTIRPIMGKEAPKYPRAAHLPGDQPHGYQALLERDALARSAHRSQVPRAFDAGHRDLWYLHQAHRPDDSSFREHDGWSHGSHRVHAVDFYLR